MPLSLVSILLLLVRLVGNIGFTHGWSSSSFLAKTSETFKLAELQFAEARLQATLHKYTVSRLLLDRSTGSSLLQLDQFPFDDVNHIGQLPSSLRRCDWILQIIGSGETGEELLDMLRGADKEKMKMMRIDQGWVLDYVRFENAESMSGDNGHGPRTMQDYTMRTLLCSVAQALPTIPALNPQQCNSTLLLVDAKTASDKQRLFFGRLWDGHSTTTESSLSLKETWDPILASRWTQRPFQYSSAINRKAAEIILDCLCDVVSTSYNTCGDMDQTSPPRLFDPTCGSGTFLALALERGFQVVGYDVNPHCAKGTRQNLVHLFGEERVDQLARIQCMDSSSSNTKPSEDKKPSCVVSNLPWGVNTASYVDENIRILQSLNKQLSPGTPCVFVTKDSEPRLFQETGFEILAQAQIPPLGFKLPKTTKKKDQVDDDVDPRNGRNSCVVTFATSK